MCSTRQGLRVRGCGVVCAGSAGPARSKKSLLKSKGLKGLA